jgi:uncharacterized protein
VALTDDGRAHAAAPATADPLATVLERIAQRLPPAQMRILRELSAAYPAPLGKEELATRVGASLTSSSFANNLGRLRSLTLPIPAR